MKVVRKATKIVYEFWCPCCGSKLQADRDEIEWLGSDLMRFFCPVCEAFRNITGTTVCSKSIYEDEE